MTWQLQIPYTAMCKATPAVPHKNDDGQQCRAASVAFACLDILGWPYHISAFEQPARSAGVLQDITPLPLPFCLSQPVACRCSKLRITEDCFAASASLGASRFNVHSEVRSVRRAT